MGCSTIQLYGYLLIKTQYVSVLGYVKNSGIRQLKSKVSGKLADEGLRLIWLGIQRWGENPQVLKYGPEVYSQLKFSEGKELSAGIYSEETK